MCKIPRNVWTEISAHEVVPIPEMEIFHFARATITNSQLLMIYDWVSKLSWKYMKEMSPEAELENEGNVSNEEKRRNMLAVNNADLSPNFSHKQKWSRMTKKSCFCRYYCVGRIFTTYLIFHTTNISSFPVRKIKIGPTKNI